MEGRKLPGSQGAGCFRQTEDRLIEVLVRRVTVSGLGTDSLQMARTEEELEYMSVWGLEWRLEFGASCRWIGSPWSRLVPRKTRSQAGCRCCCCCGDWRVE